MAAITSGTKVGVLTTGQRIFVPLCALSNDYVATTETLDCSDYVGTILSCSLAGGCDADAYRLTVDTTNSDFANGSVTITATHWANNAAVAANTDLSAVSFYPIIIAEQKLD
jgi:hypothetical protein